MMNRKKKYYLCLAFISFIVIAGIGTYLFVDSRNSRQEMDELASMAYSSLEQNDDAMEDSSAASSSDIDLNDSNTSASEATSEATVDETSEQTSNSSNIDIVSLQNVNPDIFAWINIPGTLIDYPIVQHPTDDTYYLSHGPEGMNSSHGCPFIESCDSISLQDFNTVVYGHNMNDGSMFAGLHKFEDKDFLESHREITISTADHEMSYRIFAAVMYSDTYIPYYYDDSVEADRLAFLDSLSTDCVSSRSIILDDEKVGADDHIITLSTCDRKLRDNRFIVVAVLKKIDGVDV
jgi:sortase B